MQNMNPGLAQAIFRQPYESTNWSLNYDTSSVRFYAMQRNLVARPFRKIEGIFKDYAGFMQTSAEGFIDADISFSIVASSINTGNIRRDRHLLSSDFFDTNNFPVIRFQSLSFEKGKNNEYILEGNCTMRDITKRLVFDVVYEGVKEDAWGNTIANFKATTEINRYDFGIRSNLFFEAFIEKNITISLDLEFFQLS
jgi:polyisoprenoid-binding protein YceI